MHVTHLADTSALALLPRADAAARLVSLLVGGGAATCRVIDLELVREFPVSERAAVAEERRTFPSVPVDDGTVERAIEVQAQLERALPIVPLLVAAAAERAGLVLLHDDDVFDEIASITGQPLERAVP